MFGHWLLLSKAKAGSPSDYAVLSESVILSTVKTTIVRYPPQS